MEENKIRVVIVPISNKPVIKEIPNELEVFQKYVSGYIETFYLGDAPSGRIHGICNEEGKLIGLAPNRYIVNDWICGTFLIAASNEEGDFVSLSEEDAEMIAKDFFEIIIM